MEKRGNSEVEVFKDINNELMMVLPGSHIVTRYDGRFDQNGLEKIASLKEGESTFFTV
jgi:hypothetical protein